jgi:hypothetical protein
MRRAIDTVLKGLMQFWLFHSHERNPEGAHVYDWWCSIDVRGSFEYTLDRHNKNL